MIATWRPVALLVAVLAGVGAAHLFSITGVETSGSYQLFVTALLGFGLYASTRGIALAEFRGQIRTVLLAVTIGVIAKAAIVFGVMYWVFREPDYIVLGLVVAQIDPLAAVAARAGSRMSESAKALLATWSSFDDPITVLLTVYVTAFALSARDGRSAGTVLGAGLESFGWHLLGNLLLAGAVYLVCLAADRRRRRHRPGQQHDQGDGASRRPAARGVVRVLLLLALLVVGGIAVQFSLLLALAVIGLFFRPELGRGLDSLIQIALLLAAFAIGLVLVGGIKPVEAVVLGGAAYAAQIAVALVLTIPRRWRGNRGSLALAQQNGMTAIILALLLEPHFPGTIAIVAPAIVVVNVLYGICNKVWNRWHPMLEPEPGIQEADDRCRPEPAVCVVSFPQPEVSEAGRVGHAD